MTEHRVPDYSLRLILVGDTGVGKTCLVDRLCNNHFNPVHDLTIGVEFGVKVFDLETPSRKVVIKAQLWDTAGQESFRSITRSYYRGAAGVFLCYDITRYETFRKVGDWLKDVERECHPKTRIMLVGTKTDLGHRRQVSVEEGREFAEKHGLSHCEISSKSNENVLACCTDLVRGIYDSYREGEVSVGVTEYNKDPPAVTIDPGVPETTRRTKCCGIL